MLWIVLDTPSCGSCHRGAKTLAVAVENCSCRSFAGYFCCIGALKRTLPRTKVGLLTENESFAVHSLCRVDVMNVV